MIAAGVATLLTANAVLFDDEFEVEKIYEITMDDDEEDSGIIPNDPEVAKELGYKE